MIALESQFKEQSYTRIKTKCSFCAICFDVVLCIEYCIHINNEMDSKIIWKEMAGKNGQVTINRSLSGLSKRQLKHSQNPQA